MNDHPIDPSQVARLEALYQANQQPTPWAMGMGFFAPSRSFPPSDMGAPPPSIWPLVGGGVAIASVLIVGGGVIANHLSNSREQLLRQALQEKAALKASNDRLTTQISQARQQLSQLSAATATACTQQQDALNRANQVLGATP